MQAPARATRRADAAAAAPAAVQRPGAAPSSRLRCACGGACPGCVAQAAGAALASPARPLDAALRARLQPAFGLDLGAVRVHEHAASARAFQARAWTWGRDLVFDAGAYTPATAEGAALVAHELAHAQQHQGRACGLPAALAPADGDAERAADAQVREAAAGRRRALPAAPAAPQVQRSVRSRLLDVLLFVPRLFGAGGFPAEQLRGYLADLKQRKGPARTLFSDNKARACVDRERELGPYDEDTQVWLVEDMVDGWTSGLDEGAILRLLRRSPQREAVVRRVGRQRLWNQFSGANRRRIEALTLTAAEAGDALVERLRRQDEADLQDFVAYAGEPLVRQAAERALALSRMTPPVPVDATLSPEGVADFEINGVRITVEPDRYDAALGQRAHTDVDPVQPFGPTELRLTTPGGGDPPVGERPPVVLHFRVATRYPSRAAKRGPSGYGAGTRPGDADRSLHAHELAHSAGFFEYLRANPPPAFRVTPETTLSAYNAEVRRWRTERDAWWNAAAAFAWRAGDCGGKPPTPAQLEGTGFTVADCRTP